MRTAGVIGAGQMRNDITVHKTLDRQVAKGVISADQRQAAMARITTGAEIWTWIL